MNGHPDGARWLAKLDGSDREVEAVKRSFGETALTVEVVEGESFLPSPRFEDCAKAGEVRAEASELLANINTAMALSRNRYQGLRLAGVAERRGESCTKP